MVVFKQGYQSAQNSCPQGIPRNFYVSTSQLQNCNFIDNYSSTTPSRNTDLTSISDNSSDQENDSTIQVETNTTEQMQLSPNMKTIDAFAIPLQEISQVINDDDDNKVDYVQYESKQDVQQNTDSSALRNQTNQLQDSFIQQEQPEALDSTQIDEQLSVLQLFMESLQKGIDDEQENITSSTSIVINTSESQESEVPSQQEVRQVNQQDRVVQQSCGNVLPEDDLNATCEERFKWGGCEKQWMKINNYCAKTCGFCVEDIDKIDENKSSSDNEELLAIPIPANNNYRDLNDSPSSTTRSEQEIVEFARITTPTPTTSVQQEQNAFQRDQDQQQNQTQKQQQEKDSDQQCTNVVPSDNSTASCEERKSWGGCEKNWMKEENYCAKTCGFCQISLPISQPIQQQQDTSPSPSEIGLLAMIANKLEENQISELKRKSTPEESEDNIDNVEISCIDKKPEGDEDISCQQRKEWGSCEQDWMIQGDYCAKTCNFCTDQKSEQAIDKLSFPSSSSSGNDKLPRSPSQIQTISTSPSVDIYSLVNFTNDSNQTIAQDNASEMRRKRSSGSNDNDFLEEIGKQVFCMDVIPNSESEISCQKRKEWGACDKEWMIQGQFCAKTCGYCTATDSKLSTEETNKSTVSTNEQMTTQFVEEENNTQSAFIEVSNLNVVRNGKVDKMDVSQTVTERSAGLRGNDLSEEIGKQLVCIDILPEGGQDISCQERKEWGACQKDWVISGNYCAKTCGFCDS
eukprot:TRINITY_DN1978_c0_g1_i10.p1 TRINITY_DN1978_c0_g1~~TRINITY_DN1978_c0_g1_i10.p1  ORF type:complete len:743 (-),score=133.14 TRINITY_DN1978_c0_g1_i10:1384-3612(-)